MAFDLQVFNQQTRDVMNETIAQDVAKFNEASGGALVLSNEPFDGDFSIKSAFQSIGGLVRRRNVYGDGTVQAKRLKERLNVAVKVAAGTAPVEFEPGQYAWTLRNPELAAVRIGEQLAKARMGDMLNAAVRCAVAAIGNNTGMKHDASTAKPTFNALNAAAAKFGDRSGSLRAWVMHSTVAHNLYDNALTNAERLFAYDGINVVRDPFGRVFVITDAPDLVSSSGDTTYNTLGLVEGAVIVNDNGDFNAVMQQVTGKENLGTVYQAEWSYGIALRGYAWDMASGGKSPDDAALGTGANWDKTASSDKDTAGVLLVTK